MGLCSLPVASLIDACIPMMVAITSQEAWESGVKRKRERGNSPSSDQESTGHDAKKNL